MVDKTLEEAAADKVGDIDLIQEDLHDDIAEFVWKKLKRRPAGAAGRRRSLRS